MPVLSPRKSGTYYLPDIASQSEKPISILHTFFTAFFPLIHFSFTPSHRPAVALFRKPAPSPLLHRNISQPSFLNPDYFRSAPIPAQAQIRIRISYFHSPYYNIQGTILRLPISFIQFHQSCFGPMFFLKPLFCQKENLPKPDFPVPQCPDLLPPQ